MSNYSKLSDFINNTNNTENINNLDNMKEVIQEELDEKINNILNNKNIQDNIIEYEKVIEKKLKFIYQPQINKKLKLVKVGLNQSDSTSYVRKMGEYKFMNSTYKLLEHFQDTDNLDEIFKNTDKFKLFTLNLDSEKNKINISFNYTKDNNYTITIDIYNNSIRKTIMNFTKFPGYNKVIKYLVNEMTNPIIIENYIN